MVYYVIAYYDYFILANVPLYSLFDRLYNLFFWNI